MATFAAVTSEFESPLLPPVFLQLAAMRLFCYATSSFLAKPCGKPGLDRVVHRAFLDHMPEMMRAWVTAKLKAKIFHGLRILNYQIVLKLYSACLHISTKMAFPSSHHASIVWIWLLSNSLVLRQATPSYPCLHQSKHAFLSTT